MSNLKEDKINQEIRNIVDGDIRGELFPERKFHEASVILNRLYMKHYNRLNDVSTKFAILYHLAVAEYQLGNEENAKYYIEIIKEDVESSLWYVDNKLRYCRILNIYNETHREDMTDEDYIESYYYIAECYESLKNYSEKAIALCNIYSFSKRYDKILELLKQIIELNEENVGYYSMELLKEIKDDSLHNVGLALINESNIKIS
jgi:tetratricopeptide (TPR) repeat protein